MSRILFWSILLVLLSCRRSGPSLPSVAAISASDSTEIFGLKRLADSLSWHQPDKALRLYKQSLKRSRYLHFNLGITENLIGLSFVSINRGNYAEGFTYVNEGIKHLRKLKDEKSRSMGTLLNNMGAIYLHAGNYNEAAKWSYRATLIATGNKDFAAIARNANNFGSILSEMGESERAREYLEQGKEIAYKHKTARYILSYLYLNEARIQYWSNNYDDALSKCQMSQQLAREFQQASVQHDALHLSGKIYEASGNLVKAAESYLGVLNMTENYPLGKMRAAMSMGELEMKRGQYDKARQFLLRALQDAHSLNARRELVDIYKYLASFYRKTGDFNQAFAYQDLATGLKDSILNLEKMNAVNLLEVKYRILQKDKELAENKLMIASQKNRIVQNNFIIGALILFAALTIVLLRIYYAHRQKSEQQRRKIAVWQAWSEGEEKERARIARELHDGIGGFLSTLKMQLAILSKRMPGVMAVDVYQESRNLLDNTIVEVRKTAHNLMPELILRHGLVEGIRIFCNNIQADEGLKMDFQYYGYIENLDNSFQLAVFRMVQELLQNILKHAHAHAVLVQLSRHNDILDIAVEDNGRGFVREEVTKGMGLNSMERRVKELGGNLHINSAPGKGTSIYIEFHLKGKEENSDGKARFNNEKDKTNADKSNDYR